MKGVEVFQNLDSCLAIRLITTTATVLNTIAHLIRPYPLARITPRIAPACRALHPALATMALML